MNTTGICSVAPPLRCEESLRLSGQYLQYRVRLCRQASGEAAKEKRSCIRQVCDLPHISSGEAAISVSW